MIPNLAAQEYIQLELDAIPLRAGSKDSITPGWQLSPPLAQWEYASQDSNIGLRCGGARGLAVLDSDDYKRPTWANIFAFLCGLGIEPDSYPLILTPRGGKHAYICLVGSMPGNARRYRPDFGDGEFRYGRGAYVAAPNSTTPDGQYQLISGDFRELPKIEARDILPILTINDPACKESGKNQNPNQKRPISRHALSLLSGEGIDHFPSRSEAEQAILSSLARCGLDFSEVLSLFETHPAAGKFAELAKTSHRNAVRWLAASFKTAQAWTSTHETPDRTKAVQVISWALSTPWPGRTGSIDRAVFLAHATIASEAATLVYNASVRRLAELASVNREAAYHATRRLLSAGFIFLDRPSIANCANVYRLNTLPTSNNDASYSVHFKEPSLATDNNVVAQTGHFKEAPPVTKCHVYATEAKNTLNHDVFRMRGLGKAAGEIYTALLAESLTPKELEKRTGRNRVTIWRKLRQMANLVDLVTGEVIQMVKQEGDKWCAIPVDLDRIAVIVGTAGKGERQKLQHAHERIMHETGLKFGRKKSEV